MWHNVEQNSDEWLALRSGKLTGSNIAKVMANYPKAFGEPAKKLAVDIALAQLTGRVTEQGYTNENMERGHIQEPLAKKRYEEEYFCTVTNGGFFDNGFTGDSPDGIVKGEKGLVEIKSVIPSVQYKRWKSGTYDTAYRWQLINHLHQTDYDWVDFISYCQEFTEHKQLFVFRVYAREQEVAFKQIDKRVDQFKKMVDQIKLDIAA